jgi:hypothetical protein
MNYSMNGTEQENTRMSKDNVNQPDHYNQGGVEAIDAITAATVNKTGIEAVCVANVIKYLWRYELKNGLEDVKKAQWYLNRLVAAMGSKPDPKHDVRENPCCDHVWLKETAYGSPTGRYICSKCGAVEL